MHRGNNNNNSKCKWRDKGWRNKSIIDKWNNRNLKNKKEGYDEKQKKLILLCNNNRRY